MKEKPPRDGRNLPRVRAVSRAIAILRAFTADQPLLGLGEIAEITGLDAGTIRRILITLRDEGLIQQDASSGRYSLSLGILELSAGVSDTASLSTVLETSLISLAGETGKTVYLSVLSDDKALCLARYHGKYGVEVRWWSVGETMPLNCGAGPRILLAYLGAEKQESILSGDLTALTENSNVDRDKLKKELSLIRKRGWAVTQDDVALGLSALAMPIRNHSGELVAAVSLGGLTPQIVGKQQKELLGILKQATSEMEVLIKSHRSNFIE